MLCERTRSFETVTGNVSLEKYLFLERKKVRKMNWKCLGFLVVMNLYVGGTSIHCCLFLFFCLFKKKKKFKHFVVRLILVINLFMFFSPCRRASEPVSVLRVGGEEHEPHHESDAEAARPVHREEGGRHQEGRLQGQGEGRSECRVQCAVSYFVSVPPLLCKLCKYARERERERERERDRETERERECIQETARERELMRERGGEREHMREREST